MQRQTRVRAHRDLGALARAFGTAGWHVVAGSADDAIDPLRASLAHGATHFATVRVDVRDAGAYRGVRAYNVDVAIQVRNLTGDVVSAGLQRTVNIAALSLAEAEAIAVTEVATAIAADLLVAVADTTASPRSLVVLGARRPNTPVELQRLLEAQPGVVSVQWQERGDPVVLGVTTTRDMCGVAADLAGQRRLLVTVESCTSQAATVRVLRE